MSKRGRRSLKTAPETSGGTEIQELVTPGQSVDFILPEELKIFENKKLNIEVGRSVFEKVWPLSNVDNKVIEFGFSHPRAFLDPNIELVFRGRLKRVKDNGEKESVPKARVATLANSPGNLNEVDNQASLIFGWGSTMWKSITARINDKTLPDYSSGMHPYSVLMRTLLTASRDELQNTYVNDGYILDQALSGVEGEDKGTESTTPYLVKNRNLSVDDRYSIVAGRYFDTVAKVHVDCLMPNKNTYLPPNTKVSLIFNRAEEKFYINSNLEDDTLYLQIDGIHLKTRFIFLNPDPLAAFMKSWSLAPALYDYKAYAVSYRILPATLKEHTISIEGKERLPRFLVLAFVPTDAFQGNFQRNPLFLDSYGIDDIEIDFGLTLPGVTIDCAKESRYWRFCLDNLKSTFNSAFLQNIDVKNWRSSRHIIPIDLSLGFDGLNGASLPPKGVIKLKLRFKEALTRELRCVITQISNQTLSLYQDGTTVFT